MDRVTWQAKYQVHDVDMEFIDAALKSGCVVAELENPPLDYDVIRYEMRK
jgi:hypothetical protein